MNCVLRLEGFHGVVVEADDEAGQHLDAEGIDSRDRTQNVLIHILGLECFLQAGGVGRFDTDEDPAETRVAEQLEQLGVRRHVQRSFGAEAEAVVVLVLILLQELQKFLAGRPVADEVVVDEEDAHDALLAQRIEFLSDLLQRLHAGLAPEHDDDVAELATVRAAA